MLESPDNDLVRSAIKGSEDAFTELYNRYKVRILNYLYGYIGNFATAQELAQETFISAYKNIGTFRFECKFSSWLYTIATNLAKNFIIKNRKTKEESLERPIDAGQDITLGDMIPDKTAGQDEEMDNRLLQEEIQKAIDSLPSIYKEALLLCDVDGLSYEEASEVLKCNVGTIGSRLNEARKKFRAVFKLKKGKTP
jgi:RNA polymerase sigma-70 factor (ECF subfamily)